LKLLLKILEMLMGWKMRMKSWVLRYWSF